MNMHLSWAKAYKIMLVPRSQKAAHMTELSLRSTLNLCISRDNSGRVYRPRRDDWTSLFPPNECATVDVSQMQRPTDHRCRRAGNPEGFEGNSRSTSICTMSLWLWCTKDWCDEPP